MARLGVVPPLKTAPKIVLFYTFVVNLKPMETSYTPKALTAEQLQLLTKEVKQALTELYGSRLDRVILYGSYARGDFHAESDVDFLAVLKDQEINGSVEFDRFWDIIWDQWQKVGVWTSIKVVAWHKYELSSFFFYRNVKKEGTIV